MLVVGLTGGIGSGKSTVTAHFARLGVPIVDADEISHDLVEPGKPAFDQVVAAFGTGILNDQGGLDRTRLRHIVFADPAQRRRLEAILHPLIRREIRERIFRLRGDYCILSIPLLIETGQTDLVDRVLVVDSPDDLRRRRIAERDRWHGDEIDAVLRVQTGRAERLEAADDVIVNDGDVAGLHREVERLHRKYLGLSA